MTHRFGQSRARCMALLVAFGSIVISVGWTADASVSRGGSALHPVHLRHVVRGERCPVSSGVLASTLARGLPHMQVAGSRPVYFMSVGGEPPASVDISQSARDAQGWRGQKAPWLASPDYRGPLRIRGRRIDTAGEVRFARNSGQHLMTLNENAGRNERANGWRVWPSLLLVRAPGCYALQIDGARLNETIIVRVHA
jgi:hypothetical protein